MLWLRWQDIHPSVNKCQHIYDIVLCIWHIDLIRKRVIIHRPKRSSPQELEERVRWPRHRINGSGAGGHVDRGAPRGNREGLWPICKGHAPPSACTAGTSNSGAKSKTHRMLIFVLVEALLMLAVGFLSSLLVHALRSHCTARRSVLSSF